MKRYDVIIVGAGHAGTEAALVSARMGSDTLLITMKKDTIARMPCNPSIGGVGKGQLVKEIDALGGEMAKASDANGIHFRMLNKSRGPAVWSSRAQIDRHRYSEYMRDKILSQKNLDVVEGEATDILTEGNKVSGIKTKKADIFDALSVVITPGTFLNGIIHVGLEHKEGGCYGEPASIGLSKSLKKLGFPVSTLKTGTTPRIRKESINFDKIIPQPGDERPSPFSFSTNHNLKNKIICHITYTNTKTHDIIRGGLDRSPLYTGIIKSTGVRYCPSIEDKIIRFSDRDRHQIFLEPEGLHTDWYYPNGLATSLPVDIQNNMLHSIEGLEDAEILRPGYGIEYEFIQPTELLPSLETKKIENLYLAGQINGTTGYEEAASQGLIAGINAALKSQNRPPFILERSMSYIGVLIDDLVTKGTNEPYRMFTSRVEHRLLVREDNADIRLRSYGYELGLVSKEEFDETEKKRSRIDNTISKLNSIRIRPTTEINKALEGLGTSGLREVMTAAGLLKRPQIRYEDLEKIGIEINSLPLEDKMIVELRIKYAGFIKRQLSDIKKLNDIEKIKIPPGMDFSNISGLSREIIEKLSSIKPISLGQASRISGVTPAAIMLLMVYIKKNTQAKSTSKDA